MASEAPHGRVLHHVGFSTPVRTLQIGGTVLFALLAAVLIPVLSVMWIRAASSAASVAIAIVLALVALAVTLLLVIHVLRAARAALIITTRGVRIRGLLRTVWIPWESVARIESSGHFYWRRATCVVTTDHRQLLAVVTADQYQILRGEGRDLAAQDPTAPLLPTQLAIGAHRRFLAGEFREH
ncbi:hypothetical protein CJ197_02825 [Brachybacterium sp. UMB0905]|nr:hypothetical protein CJ197_02825 [Brachybacterium sp. UMB0905]